MENGEGHGDRLPSAAASHWGKAPGGGYLCWAITTQRKGHGETPFPPRTSTWGLADGPRHWLTCVT